MDYKKQLESVINFTEQHGTVLWMGSETSDPKIFIPPLIVLKSNGQAETMWPPIANRIPDELDTEDVEEVINILSTFIGKLKVLNDLKKQK